MLRAVELSESSARLCQPHPKSGCVLTNASGDRIAEAFQFSGGGRRAEVIAVEAVENAAAGGAKGGIAYLNLEPVHGPSAGEAGPYTSPLFSSRCAFAEEFYH